MIYQHCVFDLYGTLVDIRTDEELPSLWEGMAREYAARGAVYSPKELQSEYARLVKAEEYKLSGANRDAHEGHPEIHLELVFAELFRQKGVPVDADTAWQIGRLFRALSLLYIRLYPGAKELLSALRESGKKVWLLSNAQRMFTEYELAEMGLLPYFDGIYLSSDYGCKKPDARFFRVLLEEQGIDPDTAIMIGNDGKCDIHGAKNMGLATVYIKSNISPEEPLPDADFVLEEMDLPKVQKILLSE